VLKDLNNNTIASITHHLVIPKEISFGIERFDFLRWSNKQHRSGL